MIDPEEYLFSLSNLMPQNRKNCLGIVDQPAQVFISSLSNAPQAATATQSMGLNFTVTEEQQEFLDLAEQFTKNEIIPVAPHYDRTGEYPWPVLKKAHETGLMNLHIPQVFHSFNHLFYSSEHFSYTSKLDDPTNLLWAFRF